jgi:N-acetylneuraminic acid mutarotase
MITQRRDVPDVLLADGRVLVAGGLVWGAGNNTQTWTERSELYDPATGTWSATGSLQGRRLGHSLTRLSDGRVLAAGGVRFQYESPLNTAELYSPAQGTWQQLSGTMQTARTDHQAVLLADGRVLVEGRGSAELFAASGGGTWSPTGPMIHDHGSSDTATRLQDGRVLVVGGDIGTSTANPVAAAELYDPATNTWSPTGSLQTARWDHQAFLLNDGRVLVTGGAGSGTARLTSTEIYDPTTGSWTPAASMNVARFDGGTRLADGRVLFADGDLNAPSTEIYNPATNTWTPAANMVVDRAFGASPTLLLDGRVLVAGGVPANDLAGGLAAAELYTP